ncbi:GTPase HflX [Virgibacillus soli]|uniref:GTPase HflX n=1 Tax=Paracerasibacillus soli TaxID=480284 RepID=UPI0035E7F5FF
MAKERVLIVAVNLSNKNKDHFESSLEELVSLTNTAGGTVAHVMTQNRDRIHPAYYIGFGKLNEIKLQVEAMDIDLVISNDELSSGQLRNLITHIGVRVIDRSQLILDIFASRAKTKEGKLQVELAQLQYILPRLHGQGRELSRLGGGIGTRGPGETKLETDQRHIRRRIDDIKRRLKLVVEQRHQYRKRRKTNESFQIAVVGYTNAGKSTIFNRLTDSGSLEEDKLFATLDPLTRQVRLPSGFETLITDTVGFIQDLPTTLIAAFRSTLEEASEADFIIHVVDGSHPDMEQHQKTVMGLLHELEADGIPMLTVYNKQDKFPRDIIPMYYPYFMMSALLPDDMKGFLNKIEDTLKDEWDTYHVKLEPEKGYLLHKLSRETIIDKREFNEEENNYDVSGFIRSEHPLHHRLVKGEY